MLGEISLDRHIFMSTFSSKVSFDRDSREKEKKRKKEKEDPRREKKKNPEEGEERRIKRR